MSSKKLSKSSIEAAVRAAVAASLAARGQRVAVALPGWEGYDLAARKGYPSKVQQHPTTLISVRHVSTNVTVWDTTASYLSALAGEMSRRSAEFDGWAGPTTSDYIPVGHPAHEFS